MNTNQNPEAETDYQREVRESFEDREIDAHEFAQQDAEEDYTDNR